MTVESIFSNLWEGQGAVFSVDTPLDTNGRIVEGLRERAFVSSRITDKQLRCTTCNKRTCTHVELVSTAIRRWRSDPDDPDADSYLDDFVVLDGDAPQDGETTLLALCLLSSTFCSITCSYLNSLSLSLSLPADDTEDKKKHHHISSIPPPSSHLQVGLRASYQHLGFHPPCESCSK